MRRIVLPEKLDSLSEGDPIALANRRDLRRLNAFMGNFEWVRKALQCSLDSPSTPAVEWAAGDGHLGIHLRQHGTIAELTGVDRWSRPKNWPQTWHWWQGDLQDWSGYAQTPVVLGNFILHQFQDDVLAHLGALLNQYASILVFNETLRSRTALAMAKCIGCVGAHPVTRHDAVVSVRAGFRNTELPRLLKLDSTRWTWTIQTTWLGAYRMVARRKAPSE